MDFVYSLPVKILFGRNKLEQFSDVLRSSGLERGLLVSSPFSMKNGLADKVLHLSGGLLTGCFSNISPNPDVGEVEQCVGMIRDTGARFLVALGGGSVMDCAKAASVVAGTDKPVRYFHSEKGVVAGPGLPIIAIPTTAGTGSEVTNVSVLSDAEKMYKGLIVSDHMYVKIALIDPMLTMSVPPQVTASTGLDVLAHALEGYWSRNHQPICDAMAVHAVKLVFGHLYAAYRNGDDVDAREQMCVASLLAGLAFAHPKTAAAHACSYPLTSVYHLPHGEACAFTLDKFIMLNAEAEGGRVQALAREAGFRDAEAMAAATLDLKKKMGMKCTLAEAGIPEGEVEDLAERCQHPNLLNNPVHMTKEMLVDMFMGMSR